MIFLVWLRISLLVFLFIPNLILKIKANFYRTWSRCWPFIKRPKSKERPIALVICSKGGHSTRKVCSPHGSECTGNGSPLERENRTVEFFDAIPLLIHTDASPNERRFIFPDYVRRSVTYVIHFYRYLRRQANRRNEKKNISPERAIYTLYIYIRVYLGEMTPGFVAARLADDGSWQPLVTNERDYIDRTAQ